MVLLVVLPLVLEVEELEVAEADQVVVASAVEVDVVPEVVQLVEDDVVRLEVEHPEVARRPPHPEVLAVVDLE